MNFFLTFTQHTFACYSTLSTLNIFLLFIWQLSTSCCSTSHFLLIIFYSQHSHDTLFACYLTSSALHFSCWLPFFSTPLSKSTMLTCTFFCNTFPLHVSYFDTFTVNSNFKHYHNTLSQRYAVQLHTCHSQLLLSTLHFPCQFLFLNNTVHFIMLTSPLFISQFSTSCFSTSHFHC